METAYRFGPEYYRRYYGHSRTAVTSRREMARRAEFIASFAQYLDLPVRSILDAGCGVGWLRTPLRRRFPRASYVGLEVSPYLCKSFGWAQGSLATYRPRTPFDLVICYDVLQYLDDRQARRAMTNLARITRRVLYFSALTQEDWDHHCDQSCTDGDVHLRPATWYRERLERRFISLGGGMQLKRGVVTQLWELER
jgi:SAM-dependent methyltransferase